MARSVRAPARGPAAAAIEYPSSDGKPMTEGDAQLFPMIYAVERLRLYFHRDPDVYVSANLLIYYEEGNPKRRVAPDVFVVLGVPDRMRDNYLLWEEPKAPDFVLEITGPKKWRRDQGPKRRLYQRLGVREYWQYDPTGDYLEPALQGLKLVAGRYEVLPVRKFEDGTLAGWSAVLGLEEFIKPLGLSQTEVAQRLGISLSRLNDVVRGRRRITPDTALRLARMLDMSPKFWMRLQADWDLHQAVEQPRRKPAPHSRVPGGGVAGGRLTAAGGGA